MRYETYLFDMDGTVLDTVADLAGAVNHMLAEHGFPARTVQQELIARSLPKGHDTPDFDTILAEYKAWYAAHTCVETRPYPGIPELLSRLQQMGAKVAIVTNKPEKAAGALGEKFFRGITVFGEKPPVPRKPAPDMVYRAVKELGGRLESTVYIGDSEVDIKTAGNAGVDLVAVSWGFRGRERLEQSGAEHIADTVDELYGMVK